MYSTPAIDYLIRKKVSRKHKFVIQTKIIFYSYATLAVYLIFKYFGKELMNIEPIIYVAIAAIAYSIYSIVVKPGGHNESRR